MPDEFDRFKVNPSGGDEFDRFKTTNAPSNAPKASVAPTHDPNATGVAPLDWIHENVTKPYLKPVGEALSNFAQGAGKEFAKTGYALGSMFGGWKIPVPKSFEPQGGAQKTGAFVENVAELSVPIPGLAEVRAPAGAGWLVKGLFGAAHTGADVGLKTMIHTGDVKASAEAGLAGGAVGGATEVVLPAVSNLLRKLAISQYGRVLHPLAPNAKEVAMEHVPDVLSRGFRASVARSKESLNTKFSERVTLLGKALDQEYSTLDRSTQTQLKPIYDDFGRWIERNAFTGVGTIKDPALMEAGLKKMGELQWALGPYLSQARPSTVWEVRQALDKYVFKNGLTADESLAAANQVREGAANSIRAQLNSQHPTIAALNNEFHLWRSVGELMQRNVTNELGKMQFARNAGIVGRFLMGAAVGGGEAARHGASPWEIGGAAAVMGLAFESTAWRTVSAESKFKIAELISKGNVEAASALAARLTGVALTRTGSIHAGSSSGTSSSVDRSE